MQIEVGKYYKTRCGRKVGPMKQEAVNVLSGLFENKERLWVFENGRGHGVSETMNDLVAEWYEVTKREIVPGDYGPLNALQVEASGCWRILPLSSKWIKEQTLEFARLLNEIAEAM